MIYIVESMRSPEEHLTDALYFVGNEEELTTFRRNIGSLVLGAVYRGEVKQEDAYSFFYSLKGNKISPANLPVFKEINSNSTVYGNERRRVLVEKAGQGYLTSDAMMDEFERLQQFYLPSNDVEFVNKQGLVSNYRSEEGMVPLVETDDVADYVQQAGAGAEDLGITAYGFQREVVYSEDFFHEPSIVSDRDHTSLGTVSDEGEFTPLLTLLDKSHPAVASE